MICKSKQCNCFVLQQNYCLLSLASIFFVICILKPFQTRKRFILHLRLLLGYTDKTINFQLKSNSVRVFRLTESLLFWETNKYILDEYFHTQDKMMSGQQSNDSIFYLCAFNLSPQIAISQLTPKQHISMLHEFNANVVIIKFTNPLLDGKTRLPLIVLAVFKSF